MIRPELIRDIKGLAKEELVYANMKFPLFASTHEGSSVLREEVEEAAEEMNEVINNFQIHWSVVREDGVGLETIGYIKKHAIRAIAELVQVVAMCEKYEKSASRRVQRK